MARRLKSESAGAGPGPDGASGAPSELDEIVATLRESRCDYCLSPIDVVRPNDAWAHNRVEFEYMLARAGVEYADVVFAWYCTQCDNFSIVGTDFDEQWLDSEDDAMECAKCSAAAEYRVDPAQAALKDRAKYLAMKKEFGAEAMLSGEAVHCTACGAVDFFPAV